MREPARWCPPRIGPSAVAVAIAVSLVAACGASESPAPASGSDGISSMPLEGSAAPPTPAGSTGGEATAGATADDVACSLLEAEEIVDVVGNSVESGTAALGGCEWISEPDETSIQIVTSDVAEAACTDAFDADESQERLTGFTVPAYWFYASEVGGGGAITACLASTMLILNITGGLDDEADEQALLGQARQLVEMALERL